MYTYLIQQAAGTGALRNPDAIAVESPEHRLSYRKLERRSSRLAATLLEEGIAVGDRVGLHLEKSPEAVTAILGIIKAGAAYVPLDPRMPLPRAATILHDCGVRVVIGSRGRSLPAWRYLPPGAPGPEMLIAADAQHSDRAATPRILAWPEAMERERAWEPPPQTERDLAYILYTSGSTGTPKGVMVSHRAALSFIDWAHEQFAVEQQDRVFSQAPFHFDLSIFDLFVTFKAGATLVLPPPGIAVAPADYGRFLDRAAISVFYATPAILTALATHGKLDAHPWRRLRLILFAGDVMPPRQLRSLMQTIPDARWFNLYGPTETNVCTWYEVAKAPAEDQPRIPIGKACKNFELLIAGQDGQPVQAGQAGELWVRGPALMTGYWSRPRENAACFAPNPTQPVLYGDRFYRTGDRVLREADGNLLFLGRLDNMIKTRGYRVEPEEIEHLLLRHPQVAEAVVVPVDDAVSGTLLKAVVACAADTMPDARELQRLCARHLPDYMIPRYVEFTPVLPKTSTGKLDRVRLRTSQSDP